MPINVWWSILCILFFKPFGHSCSFTKPIRLEVLFLNIQTYVSFRFQASPCLPCESFPVCQRVSRCGPTPVEVGWCPRDHSPRQSRRLAVWNCLCGVPIQCTSEETRNIVPCWYHGKVESCLRLYLH